MRLLPYGDRALLVEVDDAGAAVALARALEGLAGLVDLVPAARTLLVVLDPSRTSLGKVAAAVRAARPVPAPRSETRVVTLDVVYDGEDLQDVAATTGLTPAEVVARHSGPTYTAAFGGFLPGFAYLTGLDPLLAVPRRETPRVRVPAGSVAVAGPYTAVYPRASPGGWALLGRTDAVLFDPERDPPALLPPGTRVRFRPA